MKTTLSARVLRSGGARLVIQPKSFDAIDSAHNVEGKLIQTFRANLVLDGRYDIIDDLGEFADHYNVTAAHRGVWARAIRDELMHGGLPVMLADGRLLAGTQVGTVRDAALDLETLTVDLQVSGDFDTLARIAEATECVLHIGTGRGLFETILSIIIVDPGDEERERSTTERMIMSINAGRAGSVRRLS